MKYTKENTINRISKKMFCSHVECKYLRKEEKERNCIIDSHLQSSDTSKHPCVEVS